MIEEERGKNEERLDNLISKASSGITKFIYSKDKKIEKFLILLIVIGFVLRLIAAINLDVFADDMVHVSQSVGIISSHILSTHSNPPLFYYLTDVAFHILGYTTFASRLFPLIAGTLLIPLAFLISLNLFKNKKIALFSAFFVTFSPFLIRNTFGEASLIVLFFSFLGVYLGLLYFNSRKIIYLIISAITFGLGFLTKYNAPFFVFSLLIFSLFFVYMKKEKIITRKNISHLILFFVIILIFCIPFVTFNYLLYKDKGITDVYFSRIVQTQATQQIYGGLAGQGNSFLDNLLNLNNYGNISLLLYDDLIIMVLGLVGILFLLIKKNYLNSAFFLIFLIIPFILQSAGAPLAKHFVFMSFLLAISSGFALNEISLKIKNKKLFYIIISLLMLLMLANLSVNNGTPRYYFGESPTSQLKAYLDDNVKSSDLIVLDARIYTSRSFWLATPNHFLDNYKFISFNDLNNNISTQYKTATNVYFVECSVQDCGWGTVKDQPTLNQSSQEFFSYVSESIPIQETIGAKPYINNEIIDKGKKEVFYKIYKAKMEVNPLLLEQTDRSNVFYFVPYKYKDLSNYLFNYEIKSLFGRILQQIAFAIILLSIILTILAFLVIFFFLIRNKS